MEADYWRIVLLGESTVGKTELARQFTMNCWLDHFISYIYLDVSHPILEHPYRKQLVIDTKMSLLEIIDASGLDASSSLRDTRIEDAQGFALVYSVTSRSSFESMETYHQKVISIKGKYVVFFLVGNKCDKSASEREVSREEGAEKARQFGCEFYETSAKTAQNVERVFYTLVRELRRHKEFQESDKVVMESIKKRRSRQKCVIL